MPSYLFDFAFFRGSVDVFLARINGLAFSSDLTAVLIRQLEIDGTVGCVPPFLVGSR
jgi:hypothetical protein